ncbi:MAG: glycosyltransferase family 9 protein [bacterium]
MAKKLSVEMKIKKFITWVIYSGKSPVVIDKPYEYIPITDDSKILFLRQDRIGDVIVSTPTFKLIKKKYPNLKMDILLGEKNISTQNALNNYFNHIYFYKKDISEIFKLIRTLRKTEYTAVVDLLARTSLTSAIFLRLLKAKNKIGINEVDNVNTYSLVINDVNKSTQHIIERTASILRAFNINPEVENLELEYKLSDEIIQKVKSNAAIDKTIFTLGINLSGSRRSRFWGAQNNIDFINQIVSKYNDIEVLLFATPDYYDIVETISSQTTKARLVKTASLDEYAAAISLCDGLLTPDTSAVQYSAAFKVPCIALYNNYRYNSEEMPWFPYKAEQYSIEGTSDFMDDIPVETVIERFELVYNDYLSAKSKSPNS